MHLHASFIVPALGFIGPCLWQYARTACERQVPRAAQHHPARRGKPKSARAADNQVRSRWIELQPRRRCSFAHRRWRAGWIGHEYLADLACLLHMTERFFNTLGGKRAI